jgi:hypothetical protein
LDTFLGVSREVRARIPFEHVELEQEGDLRVRVIYDEGLNKKDDFIEFETENKLNEVMIRWTRIRKGNDAL